MCLVFLNITYYINMLYSSSHLYCNFRNCHIWRHLHSPHSTTTFILFFLLAAGGVHKSSRLSSWGTGSSLSFSHQPIPSLFQRSLLPLALSQQLELLGFHESFFHLAVPSLFPLPGPFPRSGSLVHCVLKQPVCMYRKGAPKWGGPL